MSNNKYNEAGLNLLYSAIVLQAEQEYIDAIRRDYPDLTPEEEAYSLTFYRRICRMAEQQLVISTMQGKKK